MRARRYWLAVCALGLLSMRPRGDARVAPRARASAGLHRLTLARRHPRTVGSVQSPRVVPAAGSVGAASAGPPKVAPSPGPSASVVEVVLVVDDYEDPLVVEPPGTAGVRFPVVVAAHGIQSEPEAVCDPLREAIGHRAFVLCPTGMPMGFDKGERIYGFGNAPKLWDEIEAGLEALRDKFGDGVDTTQPLYVGFSQGSILGVEVVAKEGDLPRAVFVEGGHDDWSPSVLGAYEKRGGKRVLFVTGSEYWVTRARAAVPVFAATTIALRHVHLEGEGHHFSPKVVEAIDQNLDWLVEGDKRW